MALHYTGKRPVLKGRNSNDAVHTWKGTTAVYSNYDVFNTSHVLDGAPNTRYTPGTGRHPGDITLTRMFRGLHTNFPITNVGGGTRIEGMRYRPLEKKATEGAQVFYSGYGHISRTTEYSSDYYDKTNRFTKLVDPGHSVRDDATGAPNTFGHFGPYVNKGIPVTPLEDSGYAIPEGYDNPYGKNHVQEWQGVPSSKALRI